MLPHSHPLHAASNFALARERLAAPPSHVEKAESTVSSITNASFDKYKSKNSSDESYDDSITPAEAYSNRKRQTSERFDDVPRHTLDTSSQAARPVSSFSSAGASPEQKSSSETFSAPMNKKQKISNKKVHDDDDQDQDEVFAAVMDPATTEGQLALNPTLTEAKAKVAAKREYNRRNAARARKRNKNTVAELQERVSSLTKRIEDLLRFNDVLKTQADGLKTRNRELMASRSAEEQLPPRSVSTCASSSNNKNNDTVAQLLATLQKQINETQQRQQESSISQLLSGLAAGQPGGASNLLLLLQSGLFGGNTQLLSALLQVNAAPSHVPDREAMQNQELSNSFRALGAQQPQYRQPSEPQDSDLQQLMSGISAETLVSMLLQFSSNK